MKNTKKILKTLGLLSTLALIATAMFYSATNVSAAPQTDSLTPYILTSDINLTINGATNLTIGSETGLTLPSVTVASTAQVTSGVFASLFWVDDLKGAANGYKTQLLCSNLTYGSTGTINSSQISFGVTNTAYSLMGGSDNAAVTLSGSWTALTPKACGSTLDFFKRSSAGGIYGKYGWTGYLQVSVPAYQTGGTYTGTLVYTLTEL